VARACLGLLAEGRVDFGHADIARAAGVTRATVYRWWPTKADLLREAVAEHVGHRLDPPDTGTWEGDVRELVANLARFFRDPVEVGQNALMASARDAGYNALVLEHYSPLFDAWKAVVERARQRGELRAGLDADSIMLLLASPLVLVPLLFRMDLTDDDLARHADLIVAATRRDPSGRRDP
jgi:AcrR family transcriptional regulator